ncbi:MAG: GlxA family transcriptional regulator [Candidatus Methylumidiphilus sp.]
MGKPSFQHDNTCRHIGVLAFTGCEILDVCGPLDIFCYTNFMLQSLGRVTQPVYTFEILAEQAGPVATTFGVKIVADRGIADVGDEFDTLIVAGGIGALAVRENTAMVDWVKRTAPTVRRVASICTGAFLLAESGLLDGRKATTHWHFCERLAQEYPALQVEPDRIYLRDDAIYTSGGITAGIDLALALVEADWGSDIANRVARFLLVFMRRPGGQSQFSSFIPVEAKTRMDVRELQGWIIDHPTENLGIEVLAERLAMSPRNFARVFLKEVGVTPASFVEQVRLNVARSNIEQTTLPLKQICEQSGFGSDEHMRRAFQRHLKISPQAYRERFHCNPQPLGGKEG